MGISINLTGAPSHGALPEESGASKPLGGFNTLCMFDDCGDTSTITDWVAFIDGLTPVDETTLIKQGSHAMKLGIDADRNASDNGYWRNIQNQGDLSTYQHDWIYFWLYIPDSATLGYLDAGTYALYLLIGNQFVDYNFYYVTKAELSVGWNLVKSDLDNPDATTDTVDWTAINWLQLYIKEKAGNTHDFYIIVDSIMFVDPVGK